MRLFDAPERQPDEGSEDDRHQDGKVYERFHIFRLILIKHRFATLLDGTLFRTGSADELAVEDDCSLPSLTSVQAGNYRLNRAQDKEVIFVYSVMPMTSFRPWRLSLELSETGPVRFKVVKPQHEQLQLTEFAFILRTCHFPRTNTPMAAMPVSVAARCCLFCIS